MLEFKVWVLPRAGSQSGLHCNRPARATQQDLVSNKQTNKQTNTQKQERVLAVQCIDATVRVIQKGVKLNPQSVFFLIRSIPSPPKYKRHKPKMIKTLWTLYYYLQVFWTNQLLTSRIMSHLKCLIPCPTVLPSIVIELKSYVSYLENHEWVLEKPWCRAHVPDQSRTKGLQMEPAQTGRLPWQQYETDSAINLYSILRTSHSKNLPCVNFLSWYPD